VEETERLLVEPSVSASSQTSNRALLSGGIDSTLVCWALSKLKRLEYARFTVALLETCLRRRVNRPGKSLCIWAYPR